MNHTRLIPFLAGLFLIGNLVTPAAAWWEKGHRIVTQNAVRVIAPEMPSFFREGQSTLVSLSTAADEWKQYGLELRRAESPNHYLDLEKLVATPDTFTMARDRYQAIAAYLQQDEMPQDVGLLPYQILEYYQRLTGAFAKYRNNPHDQIAQQEALFYGGILSHYAGDIYQPLHTTIHFNGRVDSQGEIISHKGIHALVDGKATNVYLDATVSFRFVKAATPYKEVRKVIVAALTESWQQVDELYRLADAGKIEQPDQATKTFFNQLLAQGSQFLANLWYTAWLESEQVKIGHD